MYLDWVPVNGSGPVARDRRTANADVLRVDALRINTDASTIPSKNSFSTDVEQNLLYLQRRIQDYSNYWKHFSEMLPMKSNHHEYQLQKLAHEDERLWLSRLIETTSCQ